MPVDTLTPDGALVTLPPPPNPFFPYTPDYRAYSQVNLAVAGGDHDELIGLAVDKSNGVHVVGYSIDGTMLFSSSVDVPMPSGGSNSFTGPVSGATNGEDGAVFALTRNSQSSGSEVLHAYALIVNRDGSVAGPALIDTSNVTHISAFATAAGFALEWMDVSNETFAGNTGGGPVFQGNLAYFTQTGDLSSPPGSSWSGNLYFPLAATVIGGLDFTVFDNQATLAGSPAITLPGEPWHATTDLATAGLADHTSAAVAWVDSGTDYVSIFNARTNSFGPVAGLDWGGASDLHLVALPDGGFVVSWENGGAYKGEVFDAAGNGGGVISLAGDAMAIDSHGDLYTVGKDSSGAEVVQTYAINGGGSSGGGGTGGQTFNSDDNSDVWIGTAGDDTFNLGRGGDVVTGNGGDDTFKFAGVPWAGGHITDFNAGDVLDLSGLMSTTSDTGTDGFADGYLQITDSAGGAQVWANYHIAGNDGWWLVETLDGVASSGLTHSGNVVSVGSSSGGGTTGQTFTSDDNGDVWVGTAGNDTFHLGRGGDWVTGGAGADTFAYAAIPWAGGGITDFNAAEGDRIEVTGLLANAGYSGSDPFADGYLKYTTDSSGNAQLWADYNIPGNDGWWLVATLDGVSTSSLHYSAGLIT